MSKFTFDDISAAFEEEMTKARPCSVRKTPSLDVLDSRWAMAARIRRRPDSKQDLTPWKQRKEKVRLSDNDGLMMERF